MIQDREELREFIAQLPQITLHEMFTVTIWDLVAMYSKKLYDEKDGELEPDLRVFYGWSWNKWLNINRYDYKMTDQEKRKILLHMVELIREGA